MKLQPVLTEKSLQEAKRGNYIFFVDRNLTKPQIEKLVNEVFGVTVSKVRTLNLRRIVKKTITGRKKVIPAQKKAIVTLSGKDKIDLFEEKSSKKAKTKTK
jgi:large subunit ribosomal protein L23